MFSNYFQYLNQKVSIKDQFPGVKDQYNNIQYKLRKVFIFAFTVERAVIHIYYKMYVFILEERNFVAAIRITP